MEFSSLCRGIFAHYIPVELDRIVDDGRELADHQVQVRYSLDLRLSGVPQGYLQNAFRDSKFMHASFICPGKCPADNIWTYFTA
jgi:hypothetical protein